MLIFTPDMRYVEVLTHGDLPRFASGVRGQGTDEENRKAMAGRIGMFGRYTVDAQGDSSGNVVEGATFPNWIGNVRTTDELRLRTKLRLSSPRRRSGLCMRFISGCASALDSLAIPA